MKQNQTKRIAIIGAGIAGLAAGWHLNRQGIQAVIFEQENKPGGRMGTRHRGGIHLDIGAQFLSTAYTHTHKICKEIGINGSWNAIPRLYHQVLRNDQFHTLGLRGGWQRWFSLMGSGLFSFRSRMRLLYFLFHLMRRSKKLDFFDPQTFEDKYDQESAYDYAARIAGKEVADYLVDPLIAGYQFESSKDLSASFLRAGSGSIFHHQLGPTYYTTGGMNLLPEALATKLGVRTGEAVTRIEATENGVEVRTPQESFLFDRVLCSTPVPVTQKLYVNPSSSQRKLFDTARYASTITAAFMVPSHLVKQLGLVCVPEVENPIICSYYCPGVREESPWETSETLVALWVRDKAARTLLDQTDEEIISTLKDALLKVCPPLRIAPDAIQPYQIYRWKSAMPKFPTGTVRQMKQLLQEAQGEQGIFFCGDWLNSPWVEGSLRSGERAANLILDSLTQKG